MNSKIKVKYKVIDNFLPKENFLIIKETMLSYDFPWYYVPDISQENKISKGTLFYMMHLLYYNAKASNFFDIIKNNLLKFMDIKALIRIKANLYPSQSIKKLNEPHQDYTFSHNGAVYSINTCNGGTLLQDGTKIDSVENRILFFDPSLYHDVEYCTDQKIRANININYF
jgi:hypothetical protein